jgi:Protein of unknown function (DUF5672)
MTAAARLELPSVTLCAVASVNLSATITAMVKCLENIKFYDAILFTDIAIDNAHPDINIIQIDHIGSINQYSKFLIEKLHNYIKSNHCLIVQWDGFIVNFDQWDDEYIQYDYIGAPWPQFTDGRDVGNGGFSLRSRRLMEFCSKLPITDTKAEDVMICRENRTLLESQGMRFAPRTIAERFAYERGRPACATFGFHGAFNLINVLGADPFWHLYCQLDERSTVYHDEAAIRRSLKTGKSGMWRGSLLWAHATPFRLARWTRWFLGRLLGQPTDR